MQTYNDKILFPFILFSSYSYIGIDLKSEFIAIFWMNQACPVVFNGSLPNEENKIFMLPAFDTFPLQFEREGQKYESSFI